MMKKSESNVMCGKKTKQTASKGKIASGVTMSHELHHRPGVNVDKMIPKGKHASNRIDEDDYMDKIPYEKRFAPKLSEGNISKIARMKRNSQTLSHGSKCEVSEKADTTCNSDEQKPRGSSADGKSTEKYPSTYSTVSEFVYGAEELTEVQSASEKQTWVSSSWKSSSTKPRKHNKQGQREIGVQKPIMSAFVKGNLDIPVEQVQRGAIQKITPTPSLPISESQFMTHWCHASQEMLQTCTKMYNKEKFCSRLMENCDERNKEIDVGTIDENSYESTCIDFVGDQKVASDPNLNDTSGIPGI